MILNKEARISDYTFTPRENNTSGGGLVTVIKRNDGLMSVVKARNGSLATLENKIRTEINWQDKNNPNKQA